MECCSEDTCCYCAEGNDACFIGIEDNTWNTKELCEEEVGGVRDEGELDPAPCQGGLFEGVRGREAGEASAEDHEVSHGGSCWEGGGEGVIETMRCTMRDFGAGIKGV